MKIVLSWVLGTLLFLVGFTALLMYADRHVAYDLNECPVHPDGATHAHCTDSGCVCEDVDGTKKRAPLSWRW